MNNPHSFRQDLSLLEATTREARLETVPLPYGEKDLEPVMSRITLDYHYDKLAKGYAQRYNRGEGDRDFNRAGSFLHNKFFVQFRPPKSANRPKGAIADIIEEKYDTWEDFQRQFKAVAMDIQGSGWVYLSTGGDIKTIANHAVRTDIALLVDWWEHAWALDYHSQKEHYLHNLWKIINWDIINERI